MHHHVPAHPAPLPAAFRRRESDPGKPDQNGQTNDDRASQASWRRLRGRRSTVRGKFRFHDTGPFVPLGWEDPKSCRFRTFGTIVKMCKGQAVRSRSRNQALADYISSCLTLLTNASREISPMNTSTSFPELSMNNVVGKPGAR